MKKGKGDSGMDVKGGITRLLFGWQVIHATAGREQICAEKLLSL